MTMVATRTVVGCEVALAPQGVPSACAAAIAVCRSRGWPAGRAPAAPDTQQAKEMWASFALTAALTCHIGAISPRSLVKNGAENLHGWRHHVAWWCMKRHIETHTLSCTARTMRSRGPHAVEATCTRLPSSSVSVLNTTLCPGLGMPLSFKADRRMSAGIRWVSNTTLPPPGAPCTSNAPHTSIL